MYVHPNLCLHTLSQLLWKVRGHVPRGRDKPPIIKSPSLDKCFTDLKMHIVKSQVIEKPLVIAEKEES